ncbi:hypothetical protein BDR07DRAFT_385643 [Suillus spraguei]|nr:hypothetical protein BDR07DRAFT_385643 [Suillus spraguei]
MILQEISPMTVETEPVVVEVAPIEAQASPMEVDASSVGDEPAVTETVVPVSIDSVPETTPEGENILDEQESAPIETEFAVVGIQSFTAEPGITPTALEAVPIELTSREVVVEESPDELHAEVAATSEPKATESEAIEDTAATSVEPITEVAESGLTEETVPVSGAVATAARAEISDVEAEEFAAEVDTHITMEKEANEESQGAIDAEDELTAPTEPELEVSIPEVILAPAEAATEPDVQSTESEEAAVVSSAAPEVPIESVVATEAESVDAHDSITTDSEPVTVFNPEPIATTETDSIIATGPAHTAVESEAPAALDVESTEPAFDSILVETVQIDVEPPSSNVSFIEDPEVDFAYTDEPQTPLAEDIPVFEEPVLDAINVKSKVQVEESFLEETTEAIPNGVVTPTGEPALVEEVAAEGVVAVEEVVTVEEPAAVEEVVTVEEPAAVEEVVTVEEPAAVERVMTVEEPAAVERVVTVEEPTAAVEQVVMVEEPAAVEETVLVEETTEVEETIPTGGVVPVDVATGEPAPIEEVPSVEVVAIEAHVPVEEIALVEDISPLESAAPVESSPPVEDTVVDDAEPIAEELVAPADDGPVLEETMPSVYATDIEVSLPSVDVVALEEPTSSIQEPLVAPEEAFAETAAPAIEEVSLTGDAPNVEETSTPPVEVSVREAVEECSALAEVDVPESDTVEELSASVEEHTLVTVEDTAVHEDPVAIEETPADAVELVSLDDRIPPTVDETPLVAEVPSDAKEPALEATSTAEESCVPEEESVTVAVSDEKISEAAVIISVEEDILVAEEPLEPLGVEVPELIVNEEAAAPTGDHELAAIEDTLVPDDQPVTIEETPATEEASVSVDDQIPSAMNEIPPIAEVPSAADEPTLDDIPITEEPCAPEDEPTTSTVEVPFATPPEEITLTAETIPVFEAALATPADPMLDDTSSPEGNTIVTEESTIESDASVTELPVAVEEPAPAACEAPIVVEAVLEEVHAALERTEDALLTSEETKDELGDLRHAEVPASLPEQPFVEESLPTAPIVEEFAPVPAEEPEILEEPHVITLQVPVHGEHSEVDKDSEPQIIHVEISNEIEETGAVEQPETTAVEEEVTEQQEIATPPALNVATDIERPKSPWTPSYSVTTQGPGVLVEEDVNAYEGDDDAAPAQLQTPEIIVDEVAAVVPEITADIEVLGQSQVEVLQLAEEQVTLGEPEEPCPKSPWAPSYSVTVQGNVAQTNEGLDDLEQLPPSATQFIAVVEFEDQPVPFTEAPISGEVISSTAVVADTHATLSTTLDESDISYSVAEAEAPEDVSSEQRVIAPAEPSVPTPLESPIVEEVPEEDIEQGSFIVDDENTQLGASDPEVERRSSIWTLSYSVTGLEPVSAPEDRAVAQDESVEHGSFIIETRSLAVVEDVLEAKSDSGLLTPVDDPVGERPKSPWTPSYSVTKQGPNDAVEEVEELDGLEHLPGPLFSVPTLAADEEPIPPVLITETRASMPPRSLDPPPSASIFPPPTAIDWSPQPLPVSSLVDGSLLHPRFLKRVAHRSTLQLENSSTSPQLKILQPLPSPPLSRKTRRRSLVGAQSCEKQGRPPYASEFLKLIIVFIIFIFILYSTFYYA